MPRLAEYRGRLERFVTKGPDQAREANQDLFFVSNTFKVFLGEQQALLHPEFFDTKVREEQKLRQAVVSDSKLDSLSIGVE